jgi:hypothetical protein
MDAYASFATGHLSRIEEENGVGCRDNTKEGEQ